MKTCHGIENLEETKPTRNGFRRFVCTSCNEIWFHGESGYFQMGRPSDPNAKTEVVSLRVHRDEKKAIDSGRKRLAVVESKE